MAPDAKLRMEVYQEGQRAFSQKTECPYRDWRMGTWSKGWRAARDHCESFTTPRPDPAPVDDLSPERLKERIDALEKEVRELREFIMRGD